MIEVLEEIKPKKLTKKQRFMEFLMEMDKLMAENPLREVPMGHDFTDKMYIRSIFIPAGAALTSKIHLTEQKRGYPAAGITEKMLCQDWLWSIPIRVK